MRLANRRGFFQVYGDIVPEALQISSYMSKGSAYTGTFS
jgi:hypothetical protein